MFKIGLDLSINANLKNKITGKETVLELAYWRKAYAIRDLLVDAANKYKINRPENCEDVTICCKPIALSPLISELIKELTYSNSKYWSDSVFEPADTRGNTLTNLDSLLTFCDWLNHECDGFTVYDRCVEVVWGSRSDFEGFEDSYNFEIYLEITNSY